MLLWAGISLLFLFTDYVAFGESSSSPITLPYRIS